MSMNERCVTVIVADSDNVNMGNRSYDLIIERSREMSTVPVEIYPNTIPIRVIDNDAPGKQILHLQLLVAHFNYHAIIYTILDANFSIISPRSVFIVREGDRIDDVRVQKFGATFLKYNVSLMVTALRGSSGMLYN